MRKLGAAMALLLASPAFGAGLEIDIAGEANGTIVIDLFEVLEYLAKRHKKINNECCKIYQRVF
jgi:hypothetical protein